MSEATDNTPECAACDGHCCTSFTLYQPRTKKPWSKKKLLKSIAYYHPAIVVHKIFVAGDWLCVKCSCALFIDGRCSDYENRYEFCKTFPTASIEDKYDCEFDGCPLAQRLLKEMENTNNE